MGNVLQCYGALAKVAPSSISAILPTVVGQILEAAENEKLLQYLPNQ